MTFNLYSILGYNILYFMHSRNKNARKTDFFDDFNELQSQTLQLPSLQPNPQFLKIPADCLTPS